MTALAPTIAHGNLSSDSRQSATWPDISVIVPVYEQWDMARGLLDALQHQSLPKDRYEIVMVDNGSRRFAPPRRLPANCQVLHCPVPGSYAARSLGVAHARAPWLAFTDADCLPDSQWLLALIAAIGAQQDPRLILAGDVRMTMDQTPPTPWAIYDFVKGIPQQSYVQRGYAATANLCVSRALFDQVGGFDTSRFSGGDADFCRRSLAAGNRIVFLPSARVSHPSRSTREQLATKARRIKGGQLHNTIKDLGCCDRGADCRGADRIAAAGGRVAPSRLKKLYWLSPLSLAHRLAVLLARKQAPLRYRVIACGVCVWLWTVEIREAWRLAHGGQAERR